MRTRIGKHTATVWLAAAVAASGAATAQQPPDPRFDGTRELLARAVAAGRIAGAVALVAQDDRVVLRAAVGDADRAADRAMTEDNLFRIASMTKPITSVAVMILVEEGRIALDDPLAKFVPEFADVRVLPPGGAGEPAPAERPITVEHLLTHTAGLTYGFFGEQPHAARYREAGVTDGLTESDLTLAEDVRRLAGMPLVGQPGGDWHYSLATDVLGRVVEVASGTPFDEFVAGRILKPLKMDDTHFVVPEDELPRLATLYRPAEDGVEPVGTGVQRNGAEIFTTTFQHPGASAYRSGGGGLVSTAGDYLRFLRMLLHGGVLDGVRVLKPDTVRRMSANRIGGRIIAFPIHGDRFGYGFGVHSPDSGQKNGAAPGAYGWAGFFGTYFWVDPKRRLAGVLMVQQHPLGAGNLWARFQQSVYDDLDRSRPAQPAAGPQPGDAYREYAVHNGGNLDWRVTDPRATAEGAWQFLPNPVLELEVGDLTGAVRAEATLDRWAGHLRTTDKSIRFNDHVWLTVPELQTTPAGQAETYYAQDNPTVAVPLEHLREGANTLEGTCRTRDGYDWGQWGLYSLILRVYQDPPAHADGAVAITVPASGATIGDHPTVQVRAPADARQVQVLAWYTGADEDGDGVYADWHGANRQLRRGEPADLSGHVGTDRDSPFELTWDTTWVPDQPPASVRLVARVQHADGLWTVSEPVERLTLERSGTHVTMVPAADVPQWFGVRDGERKSCRFTIPAEVPLARATDAALSLRTWHGWDGHHAPLRFNGHELPIGGADHHYDIDLRPLPLSSLRTGGNVLDIRSDTHHHMLEVLWPGPTLLIRHRQ